ncbi:MAG: hypothetical protein HY677_02315, partial [Chloroflexi bacterium]|nr:hypothetical protein [Chloroflexota bacterium]
ALGRLSQGESDLAVSPFCGTNIAVAAVLSATASAVALGSKNRLARLPQAILASIWAIIAAQFVGRYVQKHLTTSPHVAGMRITGITRKGFGPLTIFHISTARG